MSKEDVKKLGRYVNGQKPEARSAESDVVPACGGVPFQARSGDA